MNFWRSRLPLILIAFIGNLPATTIFRDSLPNGLIILTYQDYRLPMVDISFVCRSGAIFDPADKAGTASLCTDMLLRGTKNLTADSIAQILDFIGARYGTGTDFDHSFINLRLLSKDLTTGLDILSEIILEPTFPIDEFARAQEQALSGARRAYDYPSSFVGMEFDRLLFGKHRYSLPPRGDTATIRKITRDDLKNFHKSHFVPNNCFIVFVGAVDHNAIKNEVNRRFGNWQPGPVSNPQPPELALPEKIRVKLITRNDMNQTYIQFGHPGISIFDNDLIAIRLMSYILGGPPLSSRMGLAVREYGGLAYDVRCWFDRRLLPGAFRATVQTAKPREAIEKMLAEIRQMHEKGATKSELLKAQNYFTGSFPLSYSSNRGKLDRVTEIELYHLGIDWLEQFPARVRTTTLEQINDAAKQHLFPDRYIMVIMGNVTKDEINLPDVEWIE